MVDDESVSNNERASQLAVAVGMLLFASVIFGSGVLGDAGEDRLSDGNDRGDDVDSNAASDREEENNRLRNDRMDGDISEDMASLEIACDDGQGDIEACEEMRGMMLENRIRVNDADMREMDQRRGQEDRDMRGPIQMQVPPEIRVEMAEMWCHDHVYSTFWENIGDVQEGEEGFEIVTYDENDNIETTFVSHDAMSQLLMGLGPLVESCSEMMLMQMGVPIHHDEHEEYWSENEWCEEHPGSDDCNWMDDDSDDESDELEEEESNTPDEDEPRD
jgi:hypothetical protein